MRDGGKGDATWGVKCDRVDKLRVMRQAVRSVSPLSMIARQYKDTDTYRRLASATTGSEKEEGREIAEEVLSGTIRRKFLWVL